ncbi:MAG: C39 family peptidase, partial [Cyanobacteriota bacterium]
MNKLIIKIIALLFFIFSYFLISTSQINAQSTGQGKNLNIPYTSQENRPDCWAACIIMIAEAVVPRIDNNLMRIVFETGNTDGIRLDNLESNTTLLGYIQRRANNAQLIVRTFYDNEIYIPTSNYILLPIEIKNLLSHIRQQIDAGRPVMFCSTSKMASSEQTGPVSGHCITIVGYKDDKHYYIHDPKGRNSVDVNNLVDISYFLKNLSENTVYVTISIASPLAGDRHMLQTYLDYDAFIFERLSTATVKGDKIFYRKSFNNNNLFEWADGTGKVYQTIPELFDNLTTTGLSIKIYNASNSDQCVTALYEIGRRDNSVVLPVVSNSITAGPKSVNSFNGAAPIDINISLLRDRTNPVDCYMKLTLQDGNKRTFHEEEFDFTLDPSIQCFTLIPKFIDCNKFNFRVESVQPFPLKIQYEYEIKHQNSTFIDNFTTDQNPVEYIFTKGGKYNIRVQVTNSSSTSGKNKRVIVGEAETTVDITNPPVIIRTRPTSDEMEYELEAESCLSKPDRAWYVSEGNNPKTKLSDDSVIIRHKFPKEGSYRVYVELNDTNTKKLIAEGSVVVNVKKTKSTDEIDEAFKNKNWKKLIDLHRRANTDDEKKLIYDYLKKLADEFNDQNKKILQDLKNLKTKNDTNFNSYYTKASAQLSSLKGEEARKLSECMDNTKEKYEREKLQIEKAISYFEYTESFYNNMDVNNLGEFFFDGNDKKQLSVPYDLNKPFPEVNYETFCADTKAVEEIKKVRVSLRATNKNPKPGEIVKIEAIIERPQNSIGCPEEEYFKWTGENIALSNNEMGIPDSSASFIASKAGSYPVGVTASCMGKDFGTDSITITVQGGMTGEIKDLDSEVYFGSSKDIRLDTSLDALSQASGNTQVTEACLKQQQEYEEQKRAYEECQAANAGKSEEMQVVCRPPLPPEFDDCAGKTEGSYSVLWQASEEGIKFLPKEGSNGNTTITFTRMSDNLQVWAEVRQFNNGQLETIGRVDNSQVKVLPPEFTIEFDPNSNKAKIGETVTAQLNSNPFVDPSIIDYRWVEPTDRKEISNGKIEFVPKDNKPIKFHVIARVPHYGDTINDAIKDEFTPGEYEVVAKLVGPKFDKNFPNWSEKDKGLTYKPIKLVTGQQIVASATTKDIEPEKVNYEWKSNEGCHIDAGQYSNEVTVSRSEAGSCDLTVTAYDKDKRRLGEGTLSFNVAEQDGGSGISTGDKDKDKDADKDKADQAKKDANEKFEKAKEEISKGNLDEAITILDEATKLDPENTQIKDTLNNTKEEKKQITTHVDKANQLISEGKFDEAEKEIDEAKKINSNYKTITETVTKIKTAKSQYAEKLFNEATQLVSSGKLNEAIIKLDEAVKIDPANKKITDYKDKISSEKAFIDKTARSFNLNISGANYGEAEKDLESMD